MKDKGLDKGLIRESDTDKRIQRGWSKSFFGFRKMFWDYLNKLNVPFFDACCADAPTNPEIEPIGFNPSLGEIVRFNGTAWVPVLGFTTTTTTTTTSTTTTTTIP